MQQNMPTNRALQSSVLSLQSDVPFLLGRKTASHGSKPATTAISLTNKIADRQQQPQLLKPPALDPIAVAQLRAKAVKNAVDKSFSKAAKTGQQTDSSSGMLDVENTAGLVMETEWYLCRAIGAFTTLEQSFS